MLAACDASVATKSAQPTASPVGPAPRLNGWTDKELEGTWLATIPFQNPALLALVREIVPKSDYNRDAAVFKGETFETDAHITIATAIPEGALDTVVAGCAGGVWRADPPLERTQLCLSVGAPGVFERHVVYADGAKHDYDVLVARVESAGLVALHRRVLELSKVEHPFAAYEPHVTLAYLRSGSGKEVAAKLTERLRTQANNCELVSPHPIVPGATHAIVRAFHLKRFRDRVTPGSIVDL